MDVTTRALLFEYVLIARITFGREPERNDGEPDADYAYRLAVMLEGGP